MGATAWLRSVSSSQQGHCSMLYTVYWGPQPQEGQVVSGGYRERESWGLVLKN